MPQVEERNMTTSSAPVFDRRDSQCPVCAQHRGMPFVIQDGVGNKVMTLTCPGCQHEWQIILRPDDDAPGTDTP